MFHCALWYHNRGEHRGDWTFFRCSVVVDEPDMIEDWSRYYEDHDGLVSVRVCEC